MTASSREIAAAALLRAAVDDMLARTSLPNLTTVEPFCAEILKVATFLAPLDNLDLDMEAAKTAFLAETCGIGESRRVSDRLDVLAEQGGQQLADRKLK